MKERKIEDRLEQVRRSLRDHHAGVQPDAGFADRVVARLHHEPSEMLGWAAIRLLPAALALIVALAWMTTRDTTVEPVVDTVEYTESIEDDPINWLLEESGGTS